MKKRIYKLVIALSLIVALGMGYAYFGVKTGIFIPCMFHQITGLYCPGCGVSRMCLALMRGNFNDAVGYNPFLFFLLPFLGAYFVRQAIHYIRGEKWQMSRWESITWKVLLILLILYGIVRNLPGMDVLRPI